MDNYFHPDALGRLTGGIVTIPAAVNLDFVSMGINAFLPIALKNSEKSQKLALLSTFPAKAFLN